mmetsp:Transcript_13885/g.25423  ORF Transcript_13885/g.25423 Transcript_13885/m.25423 type:complete len:80 (-) Transcript_13885:9-248(-)
MSSDSTLAGRFSVCHGKDCKARRSKALIKKLKEELPEWEIQEGECLGECGMGPNVEAEVDGRLKIFNDVKSRDDLPFAS